ncbi:MAG: sulfite exporter TauE/SafE family protein [Alphaproteobacteria bacterium]|nr:sulfite exporter TauE/SafE family protein [Alphaproteobacteria bacterium]
MDLGFAQFGVFALALGALAFMLGGLVKGVIGLGLPMVAVPVLATVMDPKIAVALTTVPVLTSNIWIVGTSGRLRELLARYWTMLLALALFSLLGAQFFVKMDAPIASFVVGIGIVLVCIAQAFPIKAKVNARHEVWMGPVTGALAGLGGGITNFFAPLLVAYMLALRVEKDLFVFSMSLFFIVGGTPLFGSLAMYRILDLDVLAVSTAAAVVAIIGLQLGATLRRIIPQATFEKVLLFALFLIGLNLIRRGIF